MSDKLIPLSMGIIFLIIGTICLLWPEKVQNYGLKYADKGIGKINPFLGWMKTRYYIFALRILGLVQISVSIIAFIAVFKLH